MLRSSVSRSLVREETCSRVANVKSVPDHGRPLGDTDGNRKTRYDVTYLVIFSDCTSGAHVCFNLHNIRLMPSAPAFLSSKDEPVLLIKNQAGCSAVGCTALDKLQLHYALPV